MTKIWEWLNGNKTVIGTLILVATPLLLGEHTFGYELLMWLGGLLAGVGVAHKVVKPAANNS
jgi:hypothetical protein